MTRLNMMPLCLANLICLTNATHVDHVCHVDSLNLDAGKIQRHIQSPSENTCVGFMTWGNKSRGH